MSEHDDPGTRQSFEAIRRSVEATVNVESGLAELQRRSERRPRRPGLAASLVAAAALAAVVIGGVALLGGDGGQQVLNADQDDTERTTTTTVEPAACRNQQVYIYMLPDASPDQIDGVATALRGDATADEVELMDREATYAEFLELFAEQPDFVQSIRPEELPQSFRVTLSGEPTDLQVREWESMPGVLRVEFPEQYLCEAQRSGDGVTVGYRVLVDGEPIDSDTLRGSILSAHGHLGDGADVKEIERYGAAGAVMQHLLIQHGRDVGPPVSEAEIDAAITDADSMVRPDQPDVTIAPHDALTDPTVRASVSAMLYQSRGLTAVLDGSTEQAVLQSWLRDRLRERTVEVRTPGVGSLTDEEIIRYGVGPSPE